MYSLSTSEAFYQSFIHQEYYCLGRKLLPLCLRHWLLLAALKSPLTNGGAWTIADVRLAVLVLSTKSNAEFFAASKFKGIYWRLWKKVTSYALVTKERQAIYNYIDDYMPDFPFWVTEDTASTTKVPAFLVHASRLLTSCTPDYILNMPLGEVIAWNLARNETEPVQEPNKNLMTDTEVEIVNLPQFQEASN